jgi:hypothetical protein
LPSRARSRVIPLAFVATAVLYVTMGACGYAMYGADTNAQITFNLPRGLAGALACGVAAVRPTPLSGVSALAAAGQWAIVAIPPTKFALMLNPVG